MQKKVLVSAPCKDADNMVVLGVNHDKLSSEDRVVSIGSCTTNCLAPIAKILDENFGIKSGFMTTIHSYTNDQRIIDDQVQSLAHTHVGSSPIVGPFFFWTTILLFAFLRLRSAIQDLFLSLCSLGRLRMIPRG